LVIRPTGEDSALEDVVLTDLERIAEFCDLAVSAI
jgi:hypothetical protein